MKEWKREPATHYTYCRAYCRAVEIKEAESNCRKATAGPQQSKKKAAISQPVTKGKQVIREQNAPSTAGSLVSFLLLPA